VRPSPWVRYGSGLLITALAVIATYVLESRLPQTPTPLLFAAVTLSAQYGGLGPGLVSTLLSALGLEFVLEDEIGIRGVGGSSILHLCAFVLVALLVSTLNDRARRAEAQARADATRLRVLSDASRAFSVALPGHLDTLQTVARQLGDALGDACVINQLSEDGRWLIHVAWHHRNPEARALMTRLYTGQRLAADQGVSGQALLLGQPVIMNTDDPSDIRALVPHRYERILDHFPIYSILSIPLEARRRKIGTLALWRSTPGQPFTDSDRELLQELADRAALAIENARLSAYYRSLFEKIPEPTLVLGTDRQLLDVNPAAAQLLRCSQEELRGRRVDDFVLMDAASLENEFARMSTGGNWQGELQVRRSDGETVAVDGRLAPVEYLAGPVYLWVWHDLTEQQSLQHIRNTFVASASHELRTPLTAALAALGLLQQPEIGELHPTHRELTDNAMRNIQRLRILVDDLLAEGQLRVGALGLNCRPIDLRGVIAGAVESMHSLLLRKGQRIKLDIAEPLLVNGDARRLEQVFVNLLANANQHTSRGTSISIRGVVCGDEISVSVCDDGPGIPDAQVESIFERFTHVGAASSGTGLGLAIARDLTEMHGGRIWAENVPEGGLAFRLTLPWVHDGGS